MLGVLHVVLKHPQDRLLPPAFTPERAAPLRLYAVKNLSLTGQSQNPLDLALLAANNAAVARYMDLAQWSCNTSNSPSPILLLFYQVFISRGKTRRVFLGAAQGGWGLQKKILIFLTQI
jgi:hypothetical protein